MIRQIVAVIWMGLRSLPQRAGAASVIVTGIAVTVAAFVSVLAMEDGFTRVLGSTARADRAIVLRGGAEAELGSTIARADALTIMNSAGVRRNAAGRPIASAEVVTIITMPLRRDGADANVTLRGIGPNAMAVRPELHLVAGRPFRAGVRELIVGRATLARFSGLELGSRVNLENADWTIVGVFDGGDDAHDSEVFGDGETILSEFRHDFFQSITVMLDSPQAFDRFKASLTTNPTLQVKVEREADYYTAQSRSLSSLLNWLACFVGGVMAIGAGCAALNTMYTAVSSRARDIATLRAIGFGGLPVASAILAESLLLAALGGIVGCAAAWLMFDGQAVSTLGAGFGQVVFSLTVTTSLLVSGALVACLVGMLGGLPPAIRAARLPIVEALRTE